MRIATDPPGPLSPGPGAAGRPGERGVTDAGPDRIAATPLGGIRSGG